MKEATIHIFLSSVTKSLSTWLEKNLSLQNEWWHTTVLSNLSYQQQQRVERENVTSLNQLDLAALLRILDKNWYSLSLHKNLSNQERNYVKEMMVVRNRWAHLSGDAIDSDDAVRDIDTMMRLFRMVDGDATILQKMKDLKTEVSGLQLSAPVPQEKAAPEIVQTEQQSLSTIQVGSIVALKSNLKSTGAVVGIDNSGAEIRYSVFLDNRIQPLYESQICLEGNSTARKEMSLEEFHIVLTLLKLKHPSLSALYSLNAARIDFVPYQFRPAMKIIRADQPRLLIADGVGVGKTIEAGLILRELQARNNIQSVLIICPKPLIVEKKWLDEMKRFDEEFTQLDSKGLHYCISEFDKDGEWPLRHEKTIIPYSILDETLLEGTKRTPGLLTLDEAPKFDLVIVDEAHHIRNTNTLRYKVVKQFCDNAEAVVFLSATPIQLGNQDLYTLLNLLRPDLVIDETTFTVMAEPNTHINRALAEVKSGNENWQTSCAEHLKNAADTSWGIALLKKNPSFVDIQKELVENRLTREKRIQLISRIEEFHTFSRLINRTRRRDIENFCVRKPHTIRIPFTDSQKSVHDKLLAFETEMLSQLHDTQNIRFMMTTIRRQAASCIFGLKGFANDLIHRRMDMLIESNSEWSDSALSDQFLTRASDLIALTDTLSESEDTKFEALEKIIAEKQSMKNHRLMLFSSFLHTLFYLDRRLKEKGIRVGLVYGGVADEERQELRKRFELPQEEENAIDILLFSEVGTEGLDYQFCDGMVNYDLPWNPMKIEQRIGRIDRRGQKSEAVAIYNLITEQTIDAEIYDRCLLRIGIFEESIGECDEILGEINDGITSIAGDFSLSETERTNKLERLAENEIRKMEAQRTLEEREHELFGLQLPKNRDSDVLSLDDVWLSSRAIERTVRHYLEKLLGQGEYLLGENELKTLRLSESARNRVHQEFRKLPSVKKPMYRSWEKWLKGSEPHCKVTFESTCAADNRDAFFLMPLHPLILQASQFLQEIEPIYTTLQIDDSDVPAGEYPFAIYSWEFRGVKNRLELIPVCENKTIGNSLLEYLESGVKPSADVKIPADTVFQQLDRTHHELWKTERELHCQKTEEIAAFKRESLERSHKGRLSVIDTRLSNEQNEKIIKMKQREKENITADFDVQMKRIEEASKGADIIAKPVAFGVVKVVGGER